MASREPAGDVPSAQRRTDARRVLVVGCGFLGSHVTLALADSGVTPVVLTRSRPPAEVADRIDSGNLVLADACDASVVAEVVASADHVVICAGGMLPAAAEQQPEVDATGALDLLDVVTRAALDRPSLRLLFMSSGGTVYGTPRQLPVHETHPTAPVGAYGRTRVACEHLLRERSARHGLLTCSLRCANAYGEYQLPDRGQGAVATFLQRARSGTPIEVYGDGSIVRDYVYAADIARAAIALLDRPELPAVVNVGSGRGVTLTQLVELIAGEVGRSVEIVRRPARAFDVPAIVLDIGLLTQVVGLPPTSLAGGLVRTHRWLAATSTTPAMAIAEPIAQSG